MQSDKFLEMFRLRQAYMEALAKKKPGTYHPYPVDMSSKDDQRHLRDVALRGVEEVFEALQHLKNWKNHRSTDIPEVNKDKFLEEWVDAFNFFLSVLVLAGYTPEDVFKMYVEKDKIIHERLESGY